MPEDLSVDSSYPAWEDEAVEEDGCQTSAVPSPVNLDNHASSAPTGSSANSTAHLLKTNKEKKKD